MSPVKFNEMLKKLRNGEKVTCPLCNKGTMVPTGNHKTTRGFECSSCKKKLNIN